VRVLLVSAHGADRSVGGAERYVADLARGLSERGDSVSLLTAFSGSHDGSFESVATLHGSDWRTSTPRRALNRVGEVDSRPDGRVRDAVAAARPDIVHTNTLLGLTTAVWETCGRLGVPVVHTLHDYYLLCARSGLLRRDGSPCRPHALLCGTRSRRLARWAHRVSAVVGVSRHVLDRHAGVFPPHVRRELIRHALVPPANGRPPGPAEALGTLGYLGSLDISKGVGAVLEALPRLTGAGVSVRFAGDGRLRDAVTAAAVASELVHYHGVVHGAGKEAFVAACDAALVPSRWEEPGAPPYSAAEWLAAGRPVLASDRGGLGEAAAELAGMVQLTPSADGIVEAVLRLREPSRWRAAVEAAASPIGSPDDDRRWLEDHLRVYRSVVDAA
jgi:glycosyltransferase involved in cell wall biosynthesis